jgi:hypothetical protein
VSIWLYPLGSTDGSTDFDKYIMLRSVPESEYKLSKGHRLIFIGDVHGSYEPLQYVDHDIAGLRLITQAADVEDLI